MPANEDTRSTVRLSADTHSRKEIGEFSTYYQLKVFALSGSVRPTSAPRHESSHPSAQQYGLPTGCHTLPWHLHCVHTIYRRMGWAWIRLQP